MDSGYARAGIEGVDNELQQAWEDILDMRGQAVEDVDDELQPAWEFDVPCGAFAGPSITSITLIPMNRFPSTACPVVQMSRMGRASRGSQS